MGSSRQTLRVGRTLQLACEPQIEVKQSQSVVRRLQKKATQPLLALPGHSSV